MADVDECSQSVDICGVGEKCVNKQGGFSCECKKGYVKKDGVCVKGKLFKKKSIICTLKNSPFLFTVKFSHLHCNAIQRGWEAISG